MPLVHRRVGPAEQPWLHRRDEPEPGKSRKVRIYCTLGMFDAKPPVTWAVRLYGRFKRVEYDRVGPRPDRVDHHLQPGLVRSGNVATQLRDLGFVTLTKILYTAGSNHCVAGRRFYTACGKFRRC